MTKENARNAQDCHLDLGLCKKRVKRRNDRIVNKVNAGNKIVRNRWKLWCLGNESNIAKT